MLSPSRDPSSTVAGVLFSYRRRFHSPAPFVAVWLGWGMICAWRVWVSGAGRGQVPADAWPRCERARTSRADWRFDQFETGNENR